MQSFAKGCLFQPLSISQQEKEALCPLLKQPSVSLYCSWECVVLWAILGGGKSHDQRFGSAAGVRQVVVALGIACRALRHAVSVKRITRHCLPSPSVLKELLIARRRVPLNHFLRLSGGYKLAVQIFQQEVQLLQVALPLPIMAMSCKLSWRLFSQTPAYSEADTVVLAALAHKQVQGDRADEQDQPETADRGRHSRAAARVIEGGEHP